MYIVIYIVLHYEDVIVDKLTNMLKDMKPL